MEFLRPGETWYQIITTYNLAGATANADGTPSLQMYRNNVKDTNFTNSMAPVSGTVGHYDARATIPIGYQPGDYVQINSSYAVGSVPVTNPELHARLMGWNPFGPNVPVGTPPVQVQSFAQGVSAPIGTPPTQVVSFAQGVLAPVGTPPANLVLWENVAPNPLVGGRVDATLTGTPPVQVASYAQGVVSPVGTPHATIAGYDVGVSAPVGTPPVNVRLWQDVAPHPLISGRVDSNPTGTPPVNLMLWENVAPNPLVAGRVDANVAGTPSVSVASFGQGVVAPVGTPHATIAGYDPGVVTPGGTAPVIVGGFSPGVVAPVGTPPSNAVSLPSPAPSGYGGAGAGTAPVVVGSFYPGVTVPLPSPAPAGYGGSGGGGGGGTVNNYIQRGLLLTLTPDVDDGYLDMFVGDMRTFRFNLEDGLGQPVPFGYGTVNAYMTTVSGHFLGSPALCSAPFGPLSNVGDFDNTAAMSGTPGNFRLTVRQVEGADVNTYGPLPVRVLMQ